MHVRDKDGVLGTVQIHDGPCIPSCSGALSSGDLSSLRVGAERAAKQENVRLRSAKR